MPRIPIDDPDDERIRNYMGLRDHVLRQLKERPGGEMAGVFMAEGDLVVERALAAGHRLQSILIDGARRQPLPATIGEDVPVYAAAENVLQRITGYHLHRGCIACFDRPSDPRIETVLESAQRVVVLENCNNPTNLGIVIRSAVGLGMDALLLDPSSSDPYYRRASRVAMGEVFALPWARTATLPAGLGPLRAAGFTIVALTPSPEATPLPELQLAASDKVALLLGAEGPGITDESLATADVLVRIPMHRGVDSLNLGVAAAVACYALGDGRSGERVTGD